MGRKANPPVSPVTEEGRMRSALVVGSTGIIGGGLIELLARTDGWQITGLARRPAPAGRGITPVAADLTDAAATRAALAAVKPTHVFICTWLRQKTEAENCAVNGAMVRNLLDALAGKGVEHVALVTGGKHYLGPFESYAKTSPETPFREEQGRLPIANFYYVQEDEVFSAAKRDGFSWSVHRPHTVIGYAVGNAMNMASTLGAYAAIAKETGIPFVFPGSPVQYNGVTDVTDARILAEHLLWAATTPAARNEAFNIANGEVFRWRWLWPKLAAYFGLEAAPYPGEPTPLEIQMRDAAEIWPRIVAKYGLAPNPIERVASWWHSDADLGRPIEVFNDMTKSRRLGFLKYQDTVASFTDAFDRLRAERIIP
jgi:nucleoside-diphosphate-sugar epimerase